MEKSLDTKLSALQVSQDCNAFILADAKDADMAFGLSATGFDRIEGRPRSVREYRDQIRQIVSQGLIDIALFSASTCEILAGEEGIFENSTVTPAVRANDSTDIWLAAGSGSYSEQPSLPFRSMSLDRIKRPLAGSGNPMVDLGLYSVTPNNCAEADVRSFEAYAEFRREAESVGFRHFLEVFPPNAPGGNAPEDVNRFLCDLVVRTLAGLTRSERPLFLKIPYLGPKWTEELVAYDSSMIVGIMGGKAGTTFDAFKLLSEAKAHGVRAALYGRHINQAEDQLLFVQHLRWIADGEVSAEEAVRSYHDQLNQAGVSPARPLDDDLKQTLSGIASYEE